MRRCQRGRRRRGRCRGCMGVWHTEKGDRENMTESEDVDQGVPSALSNRGHAPPFPASIQQESRRALLLQIQAGGIGDRSRQQSETD